MVVEKQEGKKPGDPLMVEQACWIRAPLLACQESQAHLDPSNHVLGLNLECHVALNKSSIIESVGRVKTFFR